MFGDCSRDCEPVDTDDAVALVIIWGALIGSLLLSLL
jgi:hypothetical protein